MKTIENKNLEIKFIEKCFYTHHGVSSNLNFGTVSCRLKIWSEEFVSLFKKKKVQLKLCSYPSDPKLSSIEHLQRINLKMQLKNAIKSPGVRFLNLKKLVYSHFSIVLFPLFHGSFFHKLKWGDFKYLITKRLKRRFHLLCFFLSFLFQYFDPWTVHRWRKSTTWKLFFQSHCYSTWNL